MPLERPTRGVQGFLGVKWYEALGGRLRLLQSLTECLIRDIRRE